MLTRASVRRILLTLQLPVMMVAAAAGCGPTVAAPTTPTVSAPSAPASGAQAESDGDPYAIVGSVGSEALPDAAPDLPLTKLELPPLGGGVPAVPSACEAYVKRVGAGQVRCSDRPTALAALADALAEPEPNRRDGLLADVETCAALPPGLVRALRADLAPVECGDGIVAPLVATPPAGVTGVVYDALGGLALAARLARTVGTPPRLEPPFDKKRVDEYHRGPLAVWGRENAVAIEKLALVSSRLAYYGKAVAAVEAGVADMRFVEMVRALPVPAEFANDRELLDTYYGSLDGALEPRKTRGRDAALVGLRGLALVGVIADPRVARARALLAKMYGGRPIDALDALVLPPVQPPEPRTAEEKLAARLPTFFAGLLVEPGQATEPRLLSLLAERGVALPHRIALRSALLAPEGRLAYARARLALGRTYWRTVDFDEAAALLARWPEGQSRPSEGTLMLGVALALRGGPTDAADMMRRAPLESLGLGRVAALDAFVRANGKGPLAAAAAFDAAVIAQLATKAEASPEHWQQLGARFRAAAALGGDAVLGREARQRADDADATARAISGRPRAR